MHHYVIYAYVATSTHAWKFFLQLCHNSSHLVRTIKEVKKMSKSQDCNKLRKGDSKFVIPSSYIVMIKPNYDTTEMVSVAC